MIGALARKMFGTPNDRVLNSMKSTVAQINELEPQFEALSDEDLKGLTAKFRERHEGGETLDKLLPEAFAAVREAAKRTLGQRHFDVQLMGGMVLHQGRIAEMRTGEGKTLVATLAAYLNAIPAKGVHVVTVNDYLAARDAEWMGQVYNALGLTVGCITENEFGKDQRQAAYNADITYGTNAQFGFDYLRDNMQFSLEDMVQREFALAIVDEVDSILIDEARTPLIISGPSVDSSELYMSFNEAVKKLNEGDYEIEQKTRSAALTDKGAEHIDEICREMGLMPSGSMYDIENLNLLHYVTRALRAQHVYRRDVDYIVKSDRVIIIDEHTGRMMEGRRYGEGQHQAIEAKEGVTIQRENQTLASITLQNYFRLYPKLAGMTGTAMTEAAEFEEIYNLPVVDIPTNKPVARADEHDVIYRTEKEKTDAVIEVVTEAQEKGQPVLVGTISIEKSEELSALLKKKKIKHNVLNARYHEQEAQIISQAGRPGAVTIATNMAGRGTDIQLGGNLEMQLSEIEEGKLTDAKQAEIEKQIMDARGEVKEAGGLLIVGTERHESRRIDNQLRGRSGRQGDPGASIFFLSLEDHLMKVFGGDKIDGLLGKLGVKDGEAIFHPWINKAIEKAQKRVEGHYFEARKNILKYDNVMNDQRKVIYEQRREIMAADDLSETIRDMRHEVIEDLVAECIPPNAYAEQWDVDRLQSEVQRIFGMPVPVKDWADEEGIADQEIIERLTQMADEQIARKAVTYTAPVMRTVEKSILLQHLDQLWKEHLLTLDHIRDGINLRAYAQRDPLNEYKAEAFQLFEGLLARLREQVTNSLAIITIQIGEPGENGLTQAVATLNRGNPMAGVIDPAANPEDLAPADEALNYTAPQGPGIAGPEVMEADPETKTIDPNDPSTWGKVPRNAPCPCGSGKKYKHCHGKLD
ncbi:MAG: preprotein translocase subunit SecA [Alphaproteobacteria bacterium]|nr:preprotein translocase subunit SecA [Alphaproteobacteria bacterium SS10]